MTDKTGCRIHIVAFLPGCEDGGAHMIGEEICKTIWREDGDVEKFSFEMVDGGDKPPVVGTALRCRDCDARLTNHDLMAGWLVCPTCRSEPAPNPDLDAAAAMGGMGEDKHTTTKTVKVCRICGVYAKPADKKCPHCGCDEWLPFVQTCPVCHTPGGEHAEDCKVCPDCGGAGDMSHIAPIEGTGYTCPDCSGAGRVLVGEKEGE